jgi:hypothetical protein
VSSQEGVHRVTPFERFVEVDVVPGLGEIDQLRVRMHFSHPKRDDSRNSVLGSNDQ